MAPVVIPVGYHFNQNKTLMISRCSWPGASPLMIAYHDTEWGTSLHDDRKLFEFLILDTFQAGLSWSTILNKRVNFEKAFSGFNPKKIAAYTENDVARLLRDAGIIRNRLKVRAAIVNAQQFLHISKEYGSFDTYIWQFTKGKTIDNKLSSHDNGPTRSNESDAMSKQLKKDGFKFVGTTICYAFMQAAGMVNDHTTNCFRYRVITQK